VSARNPQPTAPAAEAARPGPFDPLPALDDLGRRLAAGDAALYAGGRPLPREAVEAALSLAGEALARKPDYFDSPAHLKNFLRQRGIWKASDGARGRKRWRAAPGVDVAELPAREPREPEVCEVVRACLRRLPEAERTALVGHYFEGATDVEVGALVFGVPDPGPAIGLRVWRLRHKALARLRRYLLEAGLGARG
jgi:DNA-directed RNA polymerase specialized sigma24 family protein